MVKSRSSRRPIIGLVLLVFVPLFLSTQRHVDNAEQGVPTKSETLKRTTTTASTKSAVVSDEKLCEGYRGILRIAGAPRSAKTGGFFFQTIVDGLIFAEQHGLYPFIWMDRIEDDHNVYDPFVMGTELSGVFDHEVGRIRNVYQHKDKAQCKYEPYQPVFGENETITERIELWGNGVWQSYFEATPIPFKDLSCHDKPVFELSYDQMSTCHNCADWSPKGWVSSKFSSDLVPQAQNMTLDEWLYRHRHRGAAVVNKYFRPQTWLLERIERNNPYVGSVY